MSTIFVKKVIKSNKIAIKKLLPVRQVLTGKSFSPYVVYINLL